MGDMTRPVIALTLIAGVIAYIITGEARATITAVLIWPTAILIVALIVAALDHSADRRIRQYRKNRGA